jgi:TolB-like protein
VIRLFLALALASTSALAAERQKVLVLDISVSSPDLKATANNLVEQLLTELSRNGRFEVIGSSDVAMLLGLERQKQLLGCGEESASCLAELGGALGAPWMISGALTRAGMIYRLDLKLMDTRQVKALSRVGRTVESQEELLRLAGSLAEELVAPIPSPPSDAPAIGRVLPWVTVGLGAVTAGVGIGLMASASAQGAALNADKANLYWADLQARGASVQGTYTTGAVLLGVGAAALAGGLLWAWLASASDAPPPMVQVGIGPGGIAIGGAF